MNFNFNRLLILLFLIFLSISGSFSNANASTSTNSLNSSNQSSQKTIYLSYSRFYKQTYVNSSVIITGTVFDFFELNFINCSIIFKDINSNNDYPNIYVDTLSKLTIINSTISYQSNESTNRNYSLFRGQFNASIYIQNSYIDSSFSGLTLFNMTHSEKLSISNTDFTNFSNLFYFSRTYYISLTNCSFVKPNPKFVFQTKTEQKTPSNYLITITNSTAVNLVNNNFENIPNILYYNSNHFLNMTGNNFTDSENVVYYQHSIKTFVKFNNFVNVTNPFLISSEDSFGSLNSSINNYIQITSIIKFNNGTNTPSGDYFKFENNYYSNFSSLYLTAFGYYEEPYHNKYFIDLFPLSKPIEYYSTRFNVLYLKTNSNYGLTLNRPNFSLVNYRLLILILFYGFILFIPLLVFLIPKISKLKKCSKRKNLKKILESFD